MEDDRRLALYRNISFVSSREPDGSRKEEEAELMKPFYQAGEFDALLTMIGKDLQASSSSLVESALSALGYLLSGVWVGPGSVSPVESVSGHEQLMVALIRLLRSDVASVRLMTTFVISSQCSPKLFAPHIPRLVSELSELLLSHHSLFASDDILVKGDDLFSQCASALVTVLDQDPVRFSGSCPQKLVSTLLEYLLRQGARFSRDDPATSAKLDHILLLRNFCAIMRSCSYDSAVQLLPTALQTFPTMMEAVKQLSKVSLVTDLECAILDFACDLWTIWLHILASLLHSSRPRAEPSTQVPPSQQLESARRKIASTSIVAFLEQAMSSGRLRLNVSERKVAFFDFITPMNAVGKLVLPLNDIRAISRARAARCYWMLARHVVTTEHWHQPSGVLKILVRCLHYFLFILPLSVAGKVDKEEELWTEADQVVLQDVCLGIHFAGQAFGELMRNLPDEEVLKVSVPLNSKTTDCKAVSLESILAALQDEALAFMSIEGAKKDAEQSQRRSPVQGCVSTTYARRRIQSQKLEVWQFVSACRAQFELQALQITHPLQHFPYSRQGSICWSQVAAMGEDRCHGLFSCSVGFRRSDILESQRLSACSLPVETNLQRLSMLSSVVDTYMLLPFDPDPLWLDCISYLVRALCLSWQCNVLAGAKKLFRLLSSDVNSISRTHQSPGVLGSQMFSQLSSSVYHCTQMTHVSSNGEFSSDEQVVLLTEHPLITSFVRQLFQSFAKIAKISGDGVWDSSVLQFHTVAVESLWWILHRTSTFQLSLGESPLSTPAIGSPQSVLSTVQSAASRLRLSFPSLAPTLVCCLAAISVVHSATHRYAAVDQMMAHAIGSSINAITESGALPQVISFLHDHIISTYTAKETGGHSSSSPAAAFAWEATLRIRTTSYSVPIPPHALVLLVQRVIEKLAEMGAPSPSDQLSPEVLDNLLFGLRSLLILPVYLLEASSNDRVLEILLSAPHCSSEKFVVADLPFMQAYSHLISNWSTLEQMHGGKGVAAFPEAGATVISLIGSVWRPDTMEKETWSAALKNGHRQCCLLTPLAHFVEQRSTTSDKGGLTRVLALKILASCLQILSLVAKAVYLQSPFARGLSQEALNLADECVVLLQDCGWLSPACTPNLLDVHIMELTSGHFYAAHMLVSILLVLHQRSPRFKAQDTLRQVYACGMGAGPYPSIAQAVSTTASILDIIVSSAVIDGCVRDWQALQEDKQPDDVQDSVMCLSGGGDAERVAEGGQDEDDDNDDDHTVVDASAEIAIVLQDDDDDDEDDEAEDDDDDSLLNVGRKMKTVKKKKKKLEKVEEVEEDTEEYRNGQRKRPRRDEMTPTNGSLGALRIELGAGSCGQPKDECSSVRPGGNQSSKIVTTESDGGRRELSAADCTADSLTVHASLLVEACAACGTASQQGTAQALMRALQLSQALSVEICQLMKAVLPADDSSNA